MTWKNGGPIGRDDLLTVDEIIFQFPNPDVVYPTEADRICPLSILFIVERSNNFIRFKLDSGRKRGS